MSNARLFGLAVAIVCMFAVVVLGRVALAQDGDDRSSDVAFEVASVKPNNSGNTRSSSMVQPGGRYTAINVTLRDLVRSAYGVRDGQIDGGPEWADDARFDVMARATGAPPPDEFREAVRPMLRRLLADRFRLKAHREMRELPVYLLKVARNDGRLGPQFKPADPACAAQAVAPASAVPSATTAPSSPPTPCGGGFNRRGALSARALPVSVLVNSLSDWADRLVLDGASLTGAFDWDLKWDPESTPESLAAAAATPNSGTTNSVSLFTALREQLGLTLDPSRASIEALIIDSAELPTPD